MFTGLIESVGVIADVSSGADGAAPSHPRTAAPSHLSTADESIRLRITTPLASELRLGDSLAVNGVCLTVVEAAGGAIQADIGPETARVTTLGSLRTGQPVNLERAMRADGRFGGHFVQGHIDGTGTVKSVREDGDARWLTVAFGETLAAYIIPKGSIAIDGVSLTIAALRGGEFDVMIIPFTWEHTNLHALAPRDRVNLECDMVGKYVARAAQIALAAR
jgi:riboflavin synthase